MSKPTLKWLASTLGAEYSASEAADDPIQRISIDTRTLQSGDLFWAIKAARDGHEFVVDALSKGAQLAVVSKQWGQSDIARSYQDKLIQVENTFDALTSAAIAWRRILKIPVVAITGSNGKTTTKDILIHLLNARFKTAGTLGNLNNELGVPLTLLSIDTDCDIAVIEMGAAKEGDIAYLCNIADPSHGLITSIGNAHLAGFKSLEVVAKTKGELYEYLETRGTGFVPLDDPLCVKQSLALRNKIGYGFCEAPTDWKSNYLQGENFAVAESGCAEFSIWNKTIKLSIPGKPIAQAALAAITVADFFEIPLDKSIEQLNSVILTGGRSSIIHIGELVVLDDSYNANPLSMQAALETFVSLPGKRKAVILGDMNELGNSEQQAHKELGKSLAQFGLSKAIFVGPLSKDADSEAQASGINTTHYPSYEALEPDLMQIAQNIDVLLIKASRSVGLERIPSHLKRLAN